MNVAVPLLFALTDKKTTRAYTVVWKELKGVLETEQRPLGRINIVLDFERAAISAVKKVFPNADVQGCAFHLSRAWNREAYRLGLRKFLRGEDSDQRVKKWWRTVKGLPFLPPHLYHRVSALSVIPVPSRHPCYRICRKFLKYLQRSWIRGPFKNLWNKFNKEVLRISDAAETYLAAVVPMPGAADGHNTYIPLYVSLFLRTPSLPLSSTMLKDTQLVK
ncbi:hypothetical protein OSTOST_11903 [Ostertagia ostertagi]